MIRTAAAAALTALAVLWLPAACNPPAATPDHSLTAQAADQYRNISTTNTTP